MSNFTRKLICVIADYGTGDLAFPEIIQRLHCELPASQFLTLSVPPFSTLATGFCAAQLALNPGASERLFFLNSAPRRDDLRERLNNEGEQLIYARLPNSAELVGPNAGFSFSFIRDHAVELRTVNVPRNGSQFRSRDIFPQALVEIAKGNYTLLGDFLPLNQVPNAPLGRIAWIDGYGNLKTTIPAQTIDLLPGTQVVLKIGNAICHAVFSNGSFDVPEGTLAFAPGSSGWSNANGNGTTRWMELFLRGGNAWERFCKPEINQEVTIIGLGRRGTDCRDKHTHRSLKETKEALLS